MSHYSTGKIALTCPEATAAALREMGYVVEVHQTPQHLYGYQGDKRPQTAHVIIRRQHVGRAANDIGFHFGGETVAHISENESKYGGYTKEWERKVTMLQGVHKATALLKKQGKRFERRTNKVGQPVLRVYA